MTTLTEELNELRRLKDIAEADGADKKKADAAFKAQEAKCLQRMEAEDAESHRPRGGGYLYSVIEKVKGQIEDRKPYVRWALENDPAIADFLQELWDLTVDRKNAPDLYAELEEKFYEAILGTSMVTYKEDGHVMNQQANAHVDDGAPMPPGLTFRPAPYISMRKS